MRGYYIHFNARDSLGVSKKIDMQLAEFRKIGTCEEVDIHLLSKSFVKNMFAVLPGYSLMWDYDKAYKCVKDPDYIYIRQVGLFENFICFIKYIKKMYPCCKVIYEIYTYPYFSYSFRTKFGWATFWKEWMLSHVLHRYVDRIVTFSKDMKIFNISTIRIINGIDVDQIDPVTTCEKSDNVIHMVSVTGIGTYTGFDRIIKGLYKYKQAEHSFGIDFTIIGAGDQNEDKYRAEIKKYQLEQIVIMPGKKQGKELDLAYIGKDIAVSDFAFYRENVYSSSALKVRDYLGKGMPIITGCHEDAFEKENFPYYLEFPNDNSVVDCEKIVEFYQRIYCGNESREQIINNIHEYAKRNIDMTITMKPVIDYILEDN